MGGGMGGGRSHWLEARAQWRRPSHSNHDGAPITKQEAHEEAGAGSSIVHHDLTYTPYTPYSPYTGSYSVDDAQIQRIKEGSAKEEQAMLYSLYSLHSRQLQSVPPSSLPPRRVSLPAHHMPPLPPHLSPSFRQLDILRTSNCNEGDDGRCAVEGVGAIDDMGDIEDMGAIEDMGDIGDMGDMGDIENMGDIEDMGAMREKVANIVTTQPSWLFKLFPTVPDTD